jgi:hypothetical protein
MRDIARLSRSTSTPARAYSYSGLAVFLERAVHGRHLADRAGELRRARCASRHRRDGRLQRAFGHLAFGVAGAWCLPQLRGGHVGLVGIQVESG